ncbi:MAG TPA: hypothetical protein VK507_05160, partial [Iamia sp.]|nr:hypothetical protein [Iamia sp.]
MTPVETADPDVALARWDRVDVDEGALGMGQGTIVLRRDDGHWSVVAALDDGIDLTGVRITDGWATGEVRSTITGDWAVGLAPQPGSLSLVQWQSLVEYLSTLDPGSAVAAGTTHALGPAPMNRPDGPITLLAVGRERGGTVPFAEVAFVP